MKLFLDELNFFEPFTAGSLPEPDLVFDDEPVEHILYGRGVDGPTPVSLFAQSRQHLALIWAAYEKGDIQAAIDAGTNLLGDDCRVSIGVGMQLAMVMKRIVPQIPNPILRFDLSPLGPLLEKLRQVAMENNSNELEKGVCESLYRWYEHRGKYEEAKSVLLKLIEIHIDEKNRCAEAVARNNLAFEYFLEDRFQEAILGFEEAAKLFEDIGELGQNANSLANCWMCRFECGGVPDLAHAESELHRLARILIQAEFWQARKPLILLARIAERKRKISDAILFVRRAIEAGVNSGTQYPETDRKYLAQLQRIKGKCHGHEARLRARFVKNRGRLRTSSRFRLFPPFLLYAGLNAGVARKSRLHLLPAYLRKSRIAKWKS